VREARRPPAVICNRSAVKKDRPVVICNRFAVASGMGSGADPENSFELIENVSSKPLMAQVFIGSDGIDFQNALRHPLGNDSG